MDDLRQTLMTDLQGWTHLSQSGLRGAQLGLGLRQLRLHLLAADADVLQLLQVPTALRLALCQHSLRAHAQLKAWPAAWESQLLYLGGVQTVRSDALRLID